jgi:hypothetical protein
MLEIATMGNYSHSGKQHYSKSLELNGSVSFTQNKILSPYVYRNNSKLNLIRVTPSSFKINKFSETSYFVWISTRAVCKVRGLTLLLRVGTLWRCGDGLFLEVHPLVSDALITTLHPLLENVLQTVDHLISCLRFPFSWLEKFRNRTGRDLN